jgi:16S rRNA G1207 methylase RsmC
MGAKEHLKDSGNLIFVIRKEQGAKSVIKDLENMYKITILGKKSGFFIINAEKSV